MGVGNLGVSELLVVAVLVLLLFGPRRLPEIGRTVGQALREFKRGLNEVKRELDEMDRSARPREEERREGPRGRLTPPGRDEPPGPEAGDDAGGSETASTGGEEPPAGEASRPGSGDGDGQGEPA